MSKRFSIVLNDKQTEALRQYAKERWMKPCEVLRMALFRYLSSKALFRIEDRKEGVAIGTDGQSSAKVDFGQFAELFAAASEVPTGAFTAEAKRNLFWPVIRFRVFERDGYKCRVCGSDGKGKLHVHHIIKRRDGGRDVEDNLVTLCPLCHSKADHHQFAEGIWSLPYPYEDELTRQPRAAAGGQETGGVDITARLNG